MHTQVNINIQSKVGVKTNILQIFWSQQLEPIPSSLVQSPMDQLMFHMHMYSRDHVCQKPKNYCHTREGDKQIKTMNDKRI